MLKLITGTFTALLLAVGLVSVTGGVATAAPYPATVDTTTSVAAKQSVRLGKRGKAKITVASGTTSPMGTVTVVVKRKGGGFTMTKTAAYSGSPVTIKTKRLQEAGKYVIKASYTPAADSVFKASASRSAFKVG